MLKKYGAIAMLLLMIVSFTIGSVSPADVSSKKYDNSMMHLRGMTGEISPFIDGALPFFGGGLPEKGHTSVILDLSGQGAMPEENFGWQAPGFMPPFWGIHMIPCNDHIDGKMIVRQAGSDTPSTFPVKFFRHQIPAMMGKAAMVSYRANTTIELNDASSSYLTFNGEILIVNDGIPYNNTTVLPEEGYNNEITMGQTVWHQAQVSGMSAAFNFDLKWNNPGDDLRLMIYTPDGHVLGPYTDVSDGKTDGRINMEIDNPNGVADGAWLFKVTGIGVSGKDEYYIRTW